METCQLFLSVHASLVIQDQVSAVAVGYLGCGIGSCLPASDSEELGLTMFHFVNPVKELCDIVAWA